MTLPAVLTHRRVIALALVPCLALAWGRYPLDLDVYRAGARAVRSGVPLYDVRLHGYGFTYSPLAAILFAPLAALSLPAATVVSTAGSLAAIAAIVRWTTPASVGPVFVGGLVVCEPVRATLWNGQINLVLMALVLADVLRVTPAQHRGHLTGLAAAVKLTPAIFVVYLLLRGRRADAARAISAFSVVTISAAIVEPADSWRFWTHEIVTGSGIGDMARPSNQSLRGVLLRLGAESLPLWLSLAVPVAAVGLWIAVRCRHEVLAAGVVGIVGCLVSPVSWTHHWVWCMPVLVGLVQGSRTRAERRWTGGLWVLAVGVDLIPRGAVDTWVPSAWMLSNAFVLAALATGTAVLVRRFLHSLGSSAKPELALG